MLVDQNITSLLVSWNDGDRESLERLLPLVEVELRRIAHSYMRRETPAHTLQTTALINEAYLRLMNSKQPEWQNRAHFYGIAANVMRRILINHARDRSAKKRGGGGVTHVTLGELPIISQERSAELVALDDALRALETFDPVKCRIVELKCFGGLTAAEIAEVVGIAIPTVNLHWRLAKAWLAREIRGSVDHNY
jgi:RNA polymerase sigma factor (TIGR02999 family)